MNAILNTLAPENAADGRLAWILSRLDAALIAAALLVLVAVCLR